MAQTFSRDVIALEIALFSKASEFLEDSHCFSFGLFVYFLSQQLTHRSTHSMQNGQKEHWTAKSFTCPWTLNPSPMAIVIHLPLSLSRQSLRLVVNVQVSNKNSNLALNFIKSNQVQLDTRLLYVNIIFIELRMRGCFRASQNCTEHKWPRDYASNRLNKVRPARKF